MLTSAFKSKSNKDKGQLERDKSSIYPAMIILLGAIVLFIESVYILFSIFWRGLFKKEVLSEQSTLGFDIEIIQK